MFSRWVDDVDLGLLITRFTFSCLHLSGPSLVHVARQSEASRQRSGRRLEPWPQSAHHRLRREWLILPSIQEFSQFLSSPKLFVFTPPLFLFHCIMMSNRHTNLVIIFTYNFLLFYHTFMCLAIAAIWPVHGCNWNYLFGLLWAIHGSRFTQLSIYVYVFFYKCYYIYIYMVCTTLILK